MTLTIIIATIKRKSTGEVLFAKQCENIYQEISFELGFMKYGEFMEMVDANWDKCIEFQHHQKETENFELNLIEKDIEL